ncbi:hypothetical protein [Streptomyces sp. GbtcB6]|uniref:hypothetical protein n=1 Tax=Streptomyces sp. GbtcB6 TaxID=2824751 RepID=UPI001C30EA8A|nr:hypothetical protein [Streptomyces sp. GbtcB6]
MNSTPVSNALALRATASAFDAQRGKLPVPGDPHRSPDSVAVARQISELGELITGLGDEVLFRAADQDREVHTARVVTSFSAAVGPVGEAASALGAVAHQLFFLEQTEHLRDARDAREAATRVIDDALGMADTALREAADSLHAASAALSPPSLRFHAARSRSTTAAPVAAPPPAGAPAAAAPDRIARSR